jgi:hypothetical protein
MKSKPGVAMQTNQSINEFLVNVNARMNEGISDTSAVRNGDNVEWSNVD